MVHLEHVVCGVRVELEVKGAESDMSGMDMEERLELHR